MEYLMGGIVEVRKVLMTESMMAELLAGQKEQTTVQQVARQSEVQKEKHWAWKKEVLKAFLLGLLRAATKVVLRDVERDD